MQYDFTSILNRQGQDAIAVDMVGEGKAFGPQDEGFDVIPMWVADMNFATVPSITEAIIARTRQPHFGYFMPRDEYYAAIQNWHRTRNGVEDMPKEAIGYENGVLGGVVSALQAFTAPADKVLLHSPTYIGFTHCITDNGREIVHSPLKQDENGIWRMDYEDMDRKLKEHHIHFAVFCSPHNPCGRVWEPEEIRKAMEVYERNHCVVVSDEIWSDLILTGYKHTPTQSVSDWARQNVIAIYAPSKTFNLAGLIGSYHVIYNEYLRDRVRATADNCHYNSMNVLSMHALLGAYGEEGEEWVNQLNRVLTQNTSYAHKFIAENFKGVSAAQPQGTYMMYLNCAEYCRAHGKTVDDLLAAAWRKGVIIQDGRPFQQEDTIRMNFALPYSRVVEAMDRLKQYVFVD